MEIVDHEKCADELDRAAHITEMANQASVDAIRWAARPEQVQNEDGSWPVTECVECDEPIPVGRLAHGKIRCVPCQEFREKSHGRG